jgi:fumarate reductase flavoprotein subunit
MRKLRFASAALLGLLVVLSGCVNTPASTAKSGKYKPGSYTAAAKGLEGPVEVTVTVDANKITAVKIKGDKETQGVGSRAVAELPDKIVKANGKVDVVSGATVTSQAIFDALDTALKQAKGDVIALSPVAFKPGTYVGTAKGYNGDLSLKVTFSDIAITNIEVAKSVETEQVGTPAFPIMFKEVQDYTSTGVDGVSGATFSSRAVLGAVEDAAKQAGCDVASLRRGARPYELKPGPKVTESYDVVIVGAGGAGMAAAAQAAQDGATVLVIEKAAEIGGNTLVSGGAFQAVQPSMVWDPNDPEATTGVYEPTKTVVQKVKSDSGRLATLKTILTWSEKPFDGTVKDKAAIKSVDDYNLPERGVHAEYLPTLLALKTQIRKYMEYADKHLSAGQKETDLTVFSTVELHIFQTYYGGLRLNREKTQWVVGDFNLVDQLCRQAYDIRPWLEKQGAQIDNQQTTLIGCLWQRINPVIGGTVDGTFYKDKWGAYFKTTENTLLKANAKNKIMYRTTAKALVVKDGRVTGVKAVQFDGTEVEVTAKKGVILATGGYGSNIKMVLDTNDYWDPKYLTSAIKTTNRNLSQGEGLVMGQAVGAAVTGLGWTQLMPLGWVDNGNLAGGTGENVIYVSPAGTPNAGKRYVNEAAERDVLSQGDFDYGAQGGQYLEISNPSTAAAGGAVSMVSGSLSAMNVPGRIMVGKLDEVAASLKLDPVLLRKTITDYDAYIIGASPTPAAPAKSSYRGTIGSCDKDEKGNYKSETYKIDTIMVRFMAPSTHHTMGGLVVDLNRHVLNEKGAIIPGLYAAGEVSGGFFAGNRLGGNAIMSILISGRVAANAAVKND